MSDEASGEKRPSRLEEKPPLQHEVLDGKCYMVCCACELPCGALTPLVQFCSYVAVFVMFGGLIGGIVASSAMDGETDPGKCKLDWAPSCLAGKVLIIALCFVSIFVAVWGLYCCCSNCNGEEVDHRKGLVTCYKCKAMLFVPPVALHFHCAKCFVPLSLTRDKPRELPDEEKQQPKARTPIVGHQVQDVDLSRDIIKAFILKADLNHDGSLTPEELDAYLKSTQGSEDHTRALLAVKTLQGTELVKTSSTDSPASPAHQKEEVVLDINASPVEDANNPTINNYTVGGSAAAAETSPALTPSAATS